MTLKKQSRARYAQIVAQLAAPAVGKPVESLKQELRALAVVLFGVQPQLVPVKVSK